MNDHDDESRLGAYAPPTDQFATFDARDEDARRGPLLLAAAFAVFVLFLGVVWSAYNQGLRVNGREGAPRLLANSEPYRERPLDPGGEQTPDTDMDVYDRLTGEDHADETVSVRPGPEEPIEDNNRPALRVETVDADQTGDDTQTEQVPDVTPRQAPDRPVQRQPEPQPAAPEATAPETRLTPAPRQAEPAPAPAATGLTVNTAGDWVVQIGSFRSQGDAEAAWVTFQSRYSAIAPGVAPDVVAAEIPDRGTYHRLRIAGFNTRDDAVSYCARLQQGGQDCLVARR